jgi:hypothetical protein
MREALASDGPALIEAVVDPNDMPMTPIIHPEHAKGLAWGLARGEPNRTQIALTMSRVLAQEMTYETSPSGSVLSKAASAVEKLTGGDGNGSRRS